MGATQAPPFLAHFSCASQSHPHSKRNPERLLPFGAAVGSSSQGRSELNLGIQAGTVARVAGAGIQVIVRPD